MKLFGCVLLMICGSCIGLCFSAAFRNKTAVLMSIADMLLGMSIMLEYSLPTVDEMLSEISLTHTELPCFMSGSPDRESVLSALKKDPDGLSPADADKLTELFTALGSADKTSEQQRLAAARAYFLHRIETERPRNEKRAELSRRLGVLGGIFAAIMLL